MKSLSLLRHGEAPQHPEGDIYRALSERGIKALHDLSENLAEKKCYFDCIICSPVTRTKETMKIILENQPQTPEIIFNEELYTYNGNDLSKFITQIDNQYNKVLLVGHNPLISQIGCDITSDNNNISFSPAMYVRFALDINHWHDYRAHCGKIDVMITP